MKGLLPSSLCLMVPWLIVTESQGKWEGKGATLEHIPGRLSSARVLFLHCQSRMGKEKSGVHRNNMHECFSQTHTHTSL